jgi:4a-hydroxytetrahydrobiopterin dehydratase
MSEPGWRSFLDAEGVGDWVVLHGGATAVFGVASLLEAAQLATALADIVGAEPNALITVACDHLAVRLTRDLWQLEPRHVEVARAISAVAASRGARSDRCAVREVQVAIASLPDAVDVVFWREVLGYAAASDDNGVDPLGHGSTVWMQELDPAKPLRHAMHLDVSVAADRVELVVAAAVAAGGLVVDDSHAPEWWTLADRSGNRVCIAAWPDGAMRGKPSDDPEPVDR